MRGEIYLTSFNEKLARYAELAVKVGVNIQPGQQLYIAAAIDAAPLVRLITQKAYETGAKQVYVDWNDDAVSRLRFELAPEDSFSDYPAWKVQEREQLAEQGAAFISVVSQSPDLLTGIDSKRIAASQKATGQALSKYRQYVQSDKISWTVIAAPSEKWAAKVFPDVPADQQIDKLWDAIFKAVRADLDQPIEAWTEHDRLLHTKVDYLNGKKYAKLHYTSPKT